MKYVDDVSIRVARQTAFDLEAYIEILYAQNHISKSTHHLLNHKLQNLVDFIHGVQADNSEKSESKEEQKCSAP